MLFATAIEPPQQLEIGSIIKQENKPFKITKITNVEFVNKTVVLVSGVGEFV